MQINTLQTQTKTRCIFNYIELIALPLLAYGYFVLGYFGIISLPVHAHSLILMGLIFFSSLIFAKHNAFLGRCFFRRDLGQFNENLKKYISDNLVKIGIEEKSNASFERFVQHHSKDMRNDNYASVAASIFPTMGILGTFISIALTMPDFASSTSSELDKEISVLLSGVGTAFYVSIYGILLSLWWIFFEKLGLSLYDRDVENAKEITKDFFWTKESLEQAYLRENLEHFSEISSMLKTLSNEKFFLKLAQGVDEKFDLFDKMLKTEAEVISLSSKQVKDSLKELRIAQDKQQNLGKVHSDILRTLQHFSKGLDDMHFNALQSYTHIKDGQKEISDSMTLLKNSLADNAEQVSLAYSKFPYELKSTQEKILNSFTDALDGSLNRFWHEGNIALQTHSQKVNDLDLDSLKSEFDATNEQSEELLKHAHELK